jgi:hypothetical protein
VQSTPKLNVDKMTRLHGRHLRIAATVCVGVTLAGCESVSGTIFPSSPSAPTASATPPNIVAAPQAGTSQFAPEIVTPGAPSGSAAGAAIETQRSDLVRLHSKMSSRNIALSNARQAWTADVAALGQGDAVLTRLSSHSQKLVKELEAFAQGSAEANAIMRRLDAISASNEADREQLNQLRGETIQTAGALDSLVNALSAENAQNTAFIAKERASLASLGLQQGLSPSQRALAPATTTSSGTPVAAATIKFDRPTVTYREALGAALKQALLRRPDAAFDVVGVTASAAQDAQDLVKARAEDVSRTMMELGVAATKIGIDSARERGVTADEVRIFVR